MPRITRVYTRTGDDGSTALGGGQRVSKSDPRIAAFGSVDELNAALGVVLSASPSPDTAAALRTIQNLLFHLGSDLCILEADKPRIPVPRIEPGHVDALEHLMDRMSARLQPLANFILPGGTPAAAQLHVARAVCRRAERDVVALARAEPVGPCVVQFLNRLSDALFVMARFENSHAGVPEPLWNSRA